MVINTAPDSKCPVESCTLHTPNGCASPYSGSLFRIATSMPYAVHASRSEDNGYLEKVCIRCTSAQAVLEQDVTIHQLVHCPAQWSSNLISVSPFFYNGTTPIVALDDSSSIITNADVANCTVASCILMTKDCASPLTDSKISLDASSPWAITALTNETDGYLIEPCIRCNHSAGHAMMDQNIVIN